MFGANYFSQIVFGALALAASVSTPGTGGGGLGANYFGQYAPGVVTAPDPGAAGTGGGGFGANYFGQYAPGVVTAPDPGPAGTGGGGFGANYFGQYAPGVASTTPAPTAGGGGTSQPIRRKPKPPAHAPAIFHAEGTGRVVFFAVPPAPLAVHRGSGGGAVEIVATPAAASMEHQISDEAIIALLLAD